MSAYRSKYGALLTMLALQCATSGRFVSAGQQYKIATYNLDSLSMHRYYSLTKAQKDALHQIVQRYDIIHLQGIEDSKVVDEITPAGEESKYTRVDNELSTFIYKTDVFKVAHATKYQRDDYVRPPYMVEFCQVDGAKECFTMVGVHLSRRSELFSLLDILHSIREEKPRHHPVIFLGDFSYYRRYKHLPEAITEQLDTTIDQWRTDNFDGFMYDRSGGVDIEHAQPHSINTIDMQALSTYLPIEASLNVITQSFGSSRRFGGPGQQIEHEFHTEGDRHLLKFKFPFHLPFNKFCIHI